MNLPLLSWSKLYKQTQQDFAEDCRFEQTLCEKDSGGRDRGGFEEDEGR
jgi:hypothetical protein